VVSAVCHRCEGQGHTRTVHGLPVECGHCRNGIVQSGPYSPESGIPCATVPAGFDARTHELTHTTRPGKLAGKLESALAKDLRRQLHQAEQERDEALGLLAELLKARGVVDETTLDLTPAGRAVLEKAKEPKR